MSAFEELLLNIFFTYDSTRPSGLEDYQAVVMVTVTDGELSSEPALTTVEVNVMNEGPRVLLDGQVGGADYSCLSYLLCVSFSSLQSTSSEAVMVDGSPSLSISSSPVVLDDSSHLTHLTITLTNPQDPTSSENIALSTSYSLPEQISLQISDGQVIELSGVASIDVYVGAISAVYYTYTRMDGIIENQPDITPR